MLYFAVKNPYEASEASFLVIRAEDKATIDEALAKPYDLIRLIMCRCGSMWLAKTIADALNYYKAKTPFDGGPDLVEVA
jgi:hypothetical protein